MELLEFFNKRARNLSVVDVKLAQGAAMCLALIVAKLIPRIMDVNVWWFMAALAVCAVKPFYVFYMREDRSSS
ncbi:MAG: hypothetical protein GTO51_08570 [Candidatus Latescibacteria bacterium]|nr:hypothetical protein [Candidatus Latescibacterota bacterium]NIM22007.1 hypothetical protein [Candidatus Latescibacterota bacterium]NIM66025.1 hypothetical protein [Candidatus Latescibacterota bacterium]NIO02433.1 hypothetical protein [Candidatus Latescibacterota bacterium]NIO29344.1 hypothetical protein [Candidatus Latescibacterota bacterium]